MDPRTFAVTMVGLALSAVLSALHLALSDLSVVALSELADTRAARGSSRGRRRLARVTRIIADTEGHARAMGMARIACNLVVAIGAAWTIAAVRHAGETAAEGGGMMTLTDALIGGAVAVALLWVVSVSFAESVARHAGERVVYGASSLIRGVHVLLSPLRPVAKGIDRVVHAVAGGTEEKDLSSIEHELREVVEAGRRGGAFDEKERVMIEAVIGLRSLTVEQIMTPRTEIEALELTSNLGVVTAFVRKGGHSRVPVYRENLDEIVGIFYVKDLLRWLAGATQVPTHPPVSPPPAASTMLPRPPGVGGPPVPRGFDLKSILRPAMFVPESKTVRDALGEMLQKRVHIAMVADEYGGTAGLITLEDIVEEVFGEIQDEYELPEDEPPRVEAKPLPGGGGTADADARAYIGDVNTALQPLGVALPEGDEYDTLGGYVLSAMGRIPREGESFQNDRMKFTVLEASPMRVLRVRVDVAPETAPEDGTRAEAAGQASAAADRAK